MKKYTILVSGFQKKACQGCHISEGAGRIIFQLVSFYALGSKSMETKVKCLGNTIRELFPSRLYVAAIDIRVTSKSKLRTSTFVLEQGQGDQRLILRKCEEGEWISNVPSTSIQNATRRREKATRNCGRSGNLGKLECSRFRLILHTSISGLFKQFYVKYGSLITGIYSIS